MNIGLGIGIPFTRSSLWASIFTPSALFLDGSTQGVWYDPSDNTTLFQDAAGTMPVTAVEQPVGLMLDKSKGLVLGPELVTNGNFDANIDGWAASGPATLTWSAGKIRVTKNATGNWAVARQNITVTIGRTYKLRCNYSNPSGATIHFYFGGTASNWGTATSGVIEFYAVPTVSNPLIEVGFNLASGAVGAYIEFDNISVRELPGNHAFQSTSANRPTLSARYNLLTETEDFSNAVWTKQAGDSGALPTVSVDAGLSPVGTQTADLITIGRSTTTGLSFLMQRLSDDGVQKSRILHVKAFTASDVGKVLDTWTFDTAVANRFAITLTTDWQKVTLPNVTLSAGGVREHLAFGYLNSGSLSPNIGEIKFYVWGASLVPANQSSLPYQRVNTATDYDSDATKFPWYLKFNGTSSSLQTASINFTATDKMFVSAGVRKLSDAAAAMVVELSANNNFYDGSFYITAPENTYSGKFAFKSSGTLPALAVSSSASAPVTKVISGVADISGDLAILRINRAQEAINSNDQGAGNYGKYPLYIGARAGTSLFFNGNLYQLVIVGKQASTEEITSTETYINTKTKAY